MRLRNYKKEGAALPAVSDRYDGEIIVSSAAAVSLQLGVRLFFHERYQLGEARREGLSSCLFIRSPWRVRISNNASITAGETKSIVNAW